MKTQWVSRKPTKTQQNPKRARLRIRLRIRLEDYRLHHAHARALYSRRGRIQLMEYGIIGTAKQVVNRAVQLIGKQHKRFA